MKKTKRIRLYLLLTLLLTAVGTAAQTYALLFDYDVAMSVYRSQNGAGVIVGWLLFGFTLILGSSLFVLPKESESRPLPPCGTGLALLAASGGTATVASSVIIALDAARVGGAIGTVSLLMAVSAFPAGAYLFVMALYRRERGRLSAILGFFPVIWMALGLMRIYFDRSSAINDPVKTLQQIALAAMMLYFLGELRAEVGKGGARLRFAFGSVSLLLGVASSVSMLALALKGVYVVRGELLLAATQLVLSLYVGGRLRDFLFPSSDSPEARLKRLVADYEQGVITEEEFAERRAELVKRL